MLTTVNLRNQSNSKQHPASESTRSLLSCGDVVEIQGPTSSGKTHLLYSLLITCVLPHTHDSTALGGWAKAGVVFDTDGSFDMSRFHQLLLGHLMLLLSDPDIANSIAQESLGRLHIFRPASSSQLAATIAHLPKYHLAYSPRVPIGLVAVDSLSSYYWSDRFTSEQQTVREKDTPGLPLALHHVLNALKMFHSMHGSAVVLNNWGLHPISNTSPVVYKQHLHHFAKSSTATRSSTSSPTELSIIQNYLPMTFHITLASAHSVRFQSSLSIRDVKDRESERRASNEFVGLIRTPRQSAGDRIVVRIASNLVSVSW